MIRYNKKNKIIIIMSFLIICIIFTILNFTNNKQEIIKLTIINKNGSTYEYPNVEYIIEYNNIFIPMNETLRGIFGDEYKNVPYQKINYKNTIIIIDKKNNLIILPNKTTINGYEVDNTVEVEIEEINNEKYIPIYLIANLPEVIAKVDNKEVYNCKSTISGIEALDKNIDIHKIIIITDYKQKNTSTEGYIGEKKGAIWREEAIKKIEKYRKKLINIELKNKDNISITNAKLDIKMNNNMFNFGTAINQMKTEKLNRKYFNLILSENSYKWGVVEQYGYNTANKLYDYSGKNNYGLKAHNLWWDYIYSKKLKEIVISDDKEKLTFEYIYNKYTLKEINIEQAKELINILKNQFESIVYEHIEDEVNRYPNIVEWDVVNETVNFQYFKYYLYDEKLLTDNQFLTTTTKYNEKYIENEEYYNFISNCFNKAREYNKNAKMVLNDEKIKGYFNSRPAEEIKTILKRINNSIDAFGIQCHINNNYSVSPQSIYNQVNQVIRETNVKDIIISEYDNYKNDRLTKYTSEEKNTKANYLRDMLIMAYSNPNISEFTMWVYYSDHFCDEERKAYEETVYPWLNYSEKGITTEEGYSTRLYKGTYTATVTLPNGKTKDIEFTVSDDTSDTVEVIIDSEITNVKIKQQPSKIKYYRNDNIDLTDGVLEISYDDGTTKELAMNDSNINIAGFDSSVLGKQTIKLNYKGHEITFEIEVEESQDNLIKNSIKNIESGNIKLKNNYNYISNNIEILNSYNSIISKINELKQNIKNIDNSKINELYKSEFDLASKIIDEYNKKTINISEEDLKNVLNNITELTSNYTELYKYYFNNDTIDNEQITNNINKLIDIYNYNKDIELQLELYYINQVKDIYNNSITGQNNYENYLNKRRIQNTCTIISKMLENKIKETAQQEAQKIGIAYNIDQSTLTNKDVIAQIKLPNSKSSIESNPNNEKYTFTENGTKNITINIRGYKYNYNIKVTNIDKTPPQITGIEQDGKYKESITPQITDENLSEVKLIKDGQEVENYKQNTAITQEGIYQLKATDKAGNETSINFVIAYPEDEKYKIENNTIKNIKGETSVEILKGKLQVDEKYTIKRKDTEIQNSDNIATGDILETESGNKYTLIVRGDLNKDGKVDIKDLVKMRKFLLLGNNLDESEEMAADTNIDGKEISIKDLVKMRIILLTQ